MRPTLGRDVGWRALPSGKSLGTDSERADQRAAQGHFARGRIVHAQAAPLVEFENAQAVAQARLGASVLGEQLVSAFRGVAGGENQQRIGLAPQLRHQARRRGLAHGLVVGCADELKGRRGVFMDQMAQCRGDELHIRPSTILRLIRTAAT